MERYPAGIDKKGFIEGRLQGLPGVARARVEVERRDDKREGRCTIRSSTTRARCSGSPIRTL